MARGFNPTWDVETEIDQCRVAAVTAAFLHFNGSVADLVGWAGAPHVAAQQDHQTTMERLELAFVDERVRHDLHRIFYNGIPALCQAEATEENFAAYYKHGNCSTVDDEPEKTHKAVVEDARKGFTLLLDDRAALLMSAGQLCDLRTRPLHIAPRTAICGFSMIADNATALG